MNKALVIFNPNAGRGRRESASRKFAMRWTLPACRTSR